MHRQHQASAQDIDNQIEDIKIPPLDLKEEDEGGNVEARRKKR